MRTMLMMCAGVALAAGLAGQALAADGVWTNEAGGNWTDTANWQDGVVAGGAEATASFPNAPTASRVVVLPSGGVTLGKVSYNRAGTDYQVRFLGGPILFEAAAPEIAADLYFAIFYNDLRSANGLFWRYGGVVATDTSYTGPTTLGGGTFYDYMDLGAVSQVAAVSNYISTGALRFNGGSLSIRGRSDGGASSSEWQLTAGDTLVRVVATGFASVTGASVSGDGIPAGTFVKSQITWDSFELSQPATLSGTSMLSFGAVTGSQSYQRFERLEMNASGGLEVLNYNGGPMLVEADDLTGGLFLTLNKLGDGTLALKGGESFGGTMELSGGTFEHLAKESGVQPVLTNLTVMAKTVFSVPEPATTSTLVNVTGLGELVKTGSGAVVMKSSPGPDSRLTVENGTLTVTTQVTPTNLVEGAWLHVDAGDPASLTLVNENGTNYVTQWRDTRANGRYAAAAEGAPRPFLREGFQNGLPVVDFGSFFYVNRIAGYGGYLNWSEACSTIREVFLVFSDTEDCVNIPSNVNWSFLLGHSGAHNFHRSFNGVLFYPSPDITSANLLNGGITVDGETASSATALTPGFHVVSLSPTGPVAASNFARDRDASTGGQRLAEVLVYDHALSDTQRRDVGAYLMNKWLKRAYPGYRSATESGIGLLKLKGDGTFTVGEGEELRVGTLELGGDIVKNGAGTLAAEVIQEAGGSLSVAEGAVALSTRAAATAPAAAPWFHVDASDPASLTLVNEDGTNYVTQWRDTRLDGVVYASAPEGVPRPFLREGFQNGLPVVDFGSYRFTDRILGYGAYLNWNAIGWGVRDVFLVFSDTPDTVNIPGNINWSFLLGGEWYNFHRDNLGLLFNGTYAHENLRNGDRNVDGVSVPNSYLLPSGFHVVSLSPVGPVAASAFARDRNAGYGGQRLAEVLIYDRMLSPTERRDTENYLSLKWLGVAAPGYAGGTVRLSGLAFSNDAHLAVEGAAGHVELGRIEANGALVKSGAGDLTVANLSDGINRLDVSGGLTVSGAYPNAWFHVDAGDPASLTLENENGTNYVTQWRDTRTNGVYASAAPGAPRPFLREGFQNGLPVVDFGSFRYEGQSIYGYGAYLNWSAECAAIREVFLVFSDTPDCVNIPGGCNWSFLLGHQGDLYNFHRNFNGVLFHPAVASPYLLNGAIAVDDTTASYATALPPGFHVVSLSPTGPVAASAFARDRNASTGGQRLAEVLIYTTELSPTARQDIRARLLSKWLDRARAFQQLRAASGSVVTLTDRALDIGTLEGEGSVSATRLSASEVSAGDAAGEIGTLSVSGTLELAAGAVVTVDCAPPAGDRIDVNGTLRLMGGGTFAVNCPTSNFGNQSLVLFTFSALEGAEHLADWSVTGDICSKYTVRPRIEGNQLLLTFTTKGTLLILK